MKFKGWFRWIAQIALGCLTLVLLSLPTAIVKAERTERSLRESVNPAADTWSPTTVTMRRGTEVSVVTKAGAIIPGKYDHRTADDLFVIATGGRVAQRIARDSIKEISVFGTGSFDRALLLGVVGFAFGYAVGQMIDASGTRDSSMDRRFYIGLATAGLGILSGATTKARRARLSADAFWGLPDTRSGNSRSNPMWRIELAIRF